MTIAETMRNRLTARLRGTPPARNGRVLSSAPNTTAADKSGIRRGSDPSSLNTAMKVLTPRPRPGDAATGLAATKRAGSVMSGYASTIDYGRQVRPQQRAVGLGHADADQHLTGIEDAQERVVPAQLIAVLRSNHRAVVVERGVRHHPRKRRLDTQLLQVRERPLVRGALAIALQLEDPQGSPIGALLFGVCSGQAVEPRLGFRRENRVLLGFDVRRARVPC